MVYPLCARITVSVCLCRACKRAHVPGCFMYNRVCYYECCVRKGKILFPWFLKCEKKVELSGHGERKKTPLIVIYNLSADSPPSLDTNLAPSTREELE